MNSRNVVSQERLAKVRSYENSVINKNVGNQEMLDKDYYLNSMIRIQWAPGS